MRVPVEHTSEVGRRVRQATQSGAQEPGRFEKGDLFSPDAGARHWYSNLSELQERTRSLFGD